MGHVVELHVVLIAVVGYAHHFSLGQKGVLAAYGGQDDARA